MRAGRESETSCPGGCSTKAGWLLCSTHTPPPCASTAKVRRNGHQTGMPCLDKTLLARNLQYDCPWDGEAVECDADGGVVRMGNDPFLAGSCFSGGMAEEEVLKVQILSLMHERCHVQRRGVYCSILCCAAIQFAAMCQNVCKGKREQVNLTTTPKLASVFPRPVTKSRANNMRAKRTLSSML